MVVKKQLLLLLLLLCSNLLVEEQTSQWKDNHSCCVQTCWLKNKQAAMCRGGKTTGVVVFKPVG